MKKEKISCRFCKHYYITWNKDFPVGCRVLNFKSKYLPSIIVRNASGMHCLSFEKKEKG